MASVSLSSNMTASELYKSFPLLPARKCIRLLKIRAKTSDDDDEQLHGELHVVDLSDTHNFAALSYVWGSFARPTDTLQCGTASINITANCKDALQQFRKTHTFFIWVDAICINQEDDEEKAFQIPLMKDIYASADPTFIWLGQGTNGTKATFEYLKVAGFQDCLLAESDTKYRIPRGISTRHIAFLTFIRTFIPIITKRQLMSVERLCLFREAAAKPGLSLQLHEIEELLLCSWMTRVWTFQEGLLAKNPLICCGDQSLPWRCFMYSVWFFEYLRRARHGNHVGPICTTWGLMCRLWLSIHEASPNACLVPDEQTSLFHADRAPDMEYQEFLGNTLKDYIMFSCMLIYFCVFAAFSLSLYAFIMYEVLKEFGPLVDTICIIWFCIIVLLFFLYSITRLGTDKKVTLLERRADGSPEYESDTVQNDLIRQIRSRKAMNPRDNVFGMHVIFELLGFSPPMPTYATPVPQVFKGLFLGLLNETKSLDLLLCCKYQIWEGPSWVPDWGIDLEKHWLDNAHAFQVREPTTLETALAGWLPDDLMAPKYAFRDAGQLVVRGFKLGKVNTHSRPFTSTASEFHAEESEQHSRNIEAICSFLKPLATSTDRDAAGQSLPKRPGSLSRGPRFIEHFAGGDIPHQIFTKRLDHRHPSYREESPFYQRYELWLFRVCQLCGTDAASRLSKLRFKLGRLFSYHIELCNELALCRRKLFVTQGGIYGNGPEEAMIGDELVQVIGMTQPLILRRLERNQYRLIGFANIHGKDCKEGRWSPESVSKLETYPEEIVLC